MMATETVNDWVVKVGFDDSEVVKGAKRVEKVMQRLARTQAKLNKNIGKVSSIKVDLDTSAFDKSARKIESTLNRFAKTRAKVNRGDELVTKPPKRVKTPKTSPASNILKKEQDELKTINSLEAKRLQLRRSIERAKDLDIETGGFTRSLRGGKVDRLEQRRLELENLITKEKRKQKDLAEKTAKLNLATAKVAPVVTPPKPKVTKAPSKFQLTDERQLKLANTIDSVIRRAARGLDKNSEGFNKLNAEAGRLKKTISGVGSRIGLEKLNNQIRILRDNTTSATATSRRLTQQMDSQKFASNSLRNSIRNLGAQYASVFLAIEGARAFFNTGREFDSINASLLAASGSYVQAGKDFEFIKDISLGLGIGLSDVATGFAKIGAAGRASGLSTGVIQQSFSDISKTVRAFGLSQDRAGLVFLGFQQILSKGVVSMQELRQQIGEQLPTAIPIAKKALKAMGSSFTSLDDAVKSGTLSAKEFVPIFSRLLRENVEESGALEASLNTITAAQQRFTSTLQLLTIRSFQAGGKKGLVFFFNKITEAAEVFAPSFKILGKVVGAAATALGGLLRAVSIMAIPFQTLIGLVNDLLGALLDIPDATEEGATNFSKLIDGMLISLKFLIGALLIIPGLIEEFFLAIDRIKDKFDFGSLSGILDVPGQIASAAGRQALETFGATFEKPLFPEKNETSTSTVNSGNNITVTIDATGAESDGVIDQIEDFFQDLFKTAVPSE
jgi:tape measure domain-containing protein